MHHRFMPVTAVALILFSAALLSAQTVFIPSGTSGIGSSTNGNVGIGTNNPSSLLTVVGNSPNAFVVQGSSSNSVGLNLNNSSAGGRNWSVFVSGGGPAAAGAFGLYDNTAGATRFVVDGSGNVGIGTAGPGAKLEVGPGAINAQAVQIRGASVAGQSYGLRINAGSNSTDNSLNVGPFDGSRNDLLINGNGNIGIGTAIPASQIHLYGAAGTTAPVTGAGAIYLQDSEGALNNGGSLLFGAAPGYWAGIKGLINNGATNTTGDLAFFTRNVVTDPTLTERVRILQNGNVGIGTPSPTGLLSFGTTLYGSADFSKKLYTYESGSVVTGWSLGAGTGGTNFRQFVNGTGSGGNSITFGYTDNGTSAFTERMRIVETGNVGIGTTNPTQKLSVNGTIQAKEVIVQTGWSDYVFKPDYHLATLSEIEGAIKKTGHLPGIPSAQEVAEHGIRMGDMQAKLLAKIEELTLRQIAQEKQLTAQAARIDQLEADNATLRNH